MDLKAPTFHASEPSHLPLGKLMDGDFKPREHLVVGQLPCQIFRYELIFETVIDEVFRRDALV